MSQELQLKHGLRLLLLKALLGAAAALAGMALLRLAGGGEIIVAVCIGLVAGVAEKSPKKAIIGVMLALIGYSVGARVGMLIAKSAQGVPLGHWAATGAFIGAVAGVARHESQSTASRIVGTIAGVVLGLVFGILGDIGGFFTVPANSLPLFFYLREVSLLCAGIFINIGAALASMIAMAVARRSEAPVAAQGAQA